MYRNHDDLIVFPLEEMVFNYESSDDLMNIVFSTFSELTFDNQFCSSSLTCISPFSEVK